MALETDAIVLEATLLDYAPTVAVKNPFQDKRKRTLWRASSKRETDALRTAGRVQLVKRTPVTVQTFDAPAALLPEPPTYWLRFIDVHIRNDKRLPCFVLLSRSHARDLSDECSVKQLEANAETVLLDIGPDGQWRGCHLPAMFEQELCVFDPLAFASVVACKPSAAKPPSALPLVFAYGAFEPYAPPPKSAEQVAREMEALSAKLLGSVMELEQAQLQGDDELSLDALQRNAKQLFRMFDQDKSNSIDFDEYRQMLAYRKLNLLESKARRFFQLVDDQKKGYIDEREFVTALYITNYLRLHARSSSKTSGSKHELPLLSPVDVFYQLDADRDERLNVFEFEKALELLGVSTATPADAARVRRQFPANASSATLEQFKAAWLQLVDVKRELRRRNLSTSTTTLAPVSSASQAPVTSELATVAPPLKSTDHESHIGVATPAVDASSSSSAAPTAAAQTASSMLSVLSLRRATHKPKALDALRRVLLDAITREEQTELEVALRAKHEVLALEKARRDAEQLAKRQLYNQQRRDATSTRTHEALRERDDKIARKKERAVKERQAKDERLLLAQITDEAARRTAHELQAVKEHMAGKIAMLARQTAASGDDVLDLVNRQLIELPSALFRGRDALNALSNLLIVDVSRNRLRALPGALFSHGVTLQALLASENELTDLPSELGDARDLRTLDVHSNALTSVPEQLKHLRKLRVLNLACNDLMVFGACCDGLEALEELNLTNNRLATLDDRVGCLVALQTLRLRGNTELTTLPSSLQQLARLVTWDLAACAQKRVAKNVFGPRLASLRTLSLAHNSLAALPSGVGALPQLQELLVTRNALAQLPLQVGGLRELVVLDASHNRLEALPDEIGQLLALETLVLASNRLSALPPTLGLLSRLQRLELRHNCLQRVPLELGALEHLHKLDVSWNDLRTLPEEIGCLRALRTFDVAHNRLTALPDTVGLWQRLETLQCAYNELATPLPPSLRDLSQLQYVDLSHNRLTRLEPCVYELARLEVLNVASNQLVSLPRELPAACARLKKLDVSNNRLAALPVEMAELLPRLDVFAIERNPLQLLPDKWCDRWRLADQYKTAFTRGYTPVEVHEWVRDQSVCYPTIVRVWHELAPPVASAALDDVVVDSGDADADSATDSTSPDTQQPNISSSSAVTATTIAPTTASAPPITPRRGIGSDEFVSRVRAAMGDAMWQNRFERLVRHYFYEFKHLGHTLVFDDVSAVERERLEAAERERERTRQQRANDAISANNAFRAHVESSYRGVDLDSVLATAAAKRKQHERSLLAELRSETRQLNDVVGPMSVQALAAREQRLQQARAQFAIDMKRAARERQQQHTTRHEALRPIAGCADHECR